MSAAATFEPYQGSGPVYRGMRVYSTYIQMRDGTCLAADLYLPKEACPAESVLRPSSIQTRYWRAMQMKAPISWLVRGAGGLPITSRAARARVLRQPRLRHPGGRRARHRGLLWRLALALGSGDRGRIRWTCWTG